jgi:hypothetical protein
MNTGEEIVIANLILPLIKDLILPKIENFTKMESVNNFDAEAFALNVETYLSQRYEKFLVIDTLVFPNKQTLFKLLYEPLTIVTNQFNEEIRIKIDGYPKKFLPNFIRTIIEDTAGMGKSTITRKLFLSAIEENAGIPILIELRQINKNNDFITEIQNQLSPLGNKISIENLLQLISKGDFIFLLDGFDEISKVDKEFVIKDLHKFIEKANENYFLITSRQEDSLVSFGDFQKFSVKPLNTKEAHNLIRRYDGYSFKPIANDLIQQLKEKKGESLNDFLSNAFLVSLLYKSFDYKKDIPIRKSQFYRQVYDALFESHDLSKEGYLKRDKNCNLHLDDFDRVLRHIAYFTSIENKVEYDKDYIINIIEKAKKHTPDLTFKASDYLQDLLETVPLFKKDGNFIKWAHKSLQDYFSAKFLWIDSKQNQITILEKIYNDKDNQRFYNVLDLFFELDQNLFEETILYWLLLDFENYVLKNYQNFKHINLDLIKTRLENNFHKDCTIAITKKEEYEFIISEKNEEEVFEFYLNLVGNKFKSCPVNFNYFEKPKVVALTFINIVSNQETILKLISRRIPSLAKYTPHKVNLNELKVLEEGQVYNIDDEVENIVNHDRVFEITNDLLISDHTINFDNAFQKLKEINLRLNVEIKNDFTKW